jgi:phage terminase large subunit GpA-like protein
MANPRRRPGGRGAIGKRRPQETQTVCGDVELNPGKASDPPGMCHFPDFIDDVYFKQLTSEYVVNEIGRHGRPKRVWRLRHGRDNHLLDCRVYNLALAEYLGLQKMSSDEWAMLARERGAPAGEELALWKAAAMAGVDGPATTDTDGEAAAVVAEVAVIAPKMTWREAVDKLKRGH